MKMANVGLCASVLVVTTMIFAPAQRAMAQEGVPLLINYQGELGSPSTGEPVPDGDYDMVFRIYDVPGGGEMLWTGTHSTANGNRVRVVDGIFSVVLGSGTGNALDPSVFEGADRWLEIQVGSETLSPRHRIASGPYAFKSENSRLLDGKEKKDFAPSEHSHSGSDIKSGTVPEAQIDEAMTRDTEKDAAIAAHAAIADAHHARYTDAEAVAAMGAKADANPLNHDKTTSLPWGSITSIPAGFADGVDNDSGGASWLLTGNTGTSGANFLGTGDNQALELRVNSARALRLEPNATSPNVIGGYSENAVTPGVYAATIAGGGAGWPVFPNRVTDSYGTVAGGGNNFAGNANGDTMDAIYATVGGGLNNTASGPYATVGGGGPNDASGPYATVGGGLGNNVSGVFGTIAGGGRSDPNDAATGNRVTDDYGTIGGGGGNQAGDNAGTTDDALYATVGGGHCNTAGSAYATVAGGGQNTASGLYYATVGGGAVNTASGTYATVGGGLQNTASAGYATVGGGYRNSASGDYATVAGGGDNAAYPEYATVGGGFLNLAYQQYATVGGGFINQAGGDSATVGGGYRNEASGYSATVPGGFSSHAIGDHSLAAGYMAWANHNGGFVWADMSGFPFYSTAINEFSARATGGARFVSAIDATGNPTAGVTLAAGGGSWSSLSDRGLKENFLSMNGKQILARLMAVPISAWNYKAQDPFIRHMGPLAQDFYAAFGLGEDDKHISTVDADGVALAAIQGLYELLREKDAEIAAIKNQNAELQQRLSAIEKLFEKFSQER